MNNVISNFRYLNPFNTKVAYIGWLGHRNLGDEALFQAIQGTFNKFTFLPYKRTKKTILIEKIFQNKLYSGVFLGGGTLINKEGMLNIFIEAQEEYSPSVVFGTGVANPEFWEKKLSMKIPLERWAERLMKCSYVGVRGPISRAILANAGFPGADVIGDPALFFGRDRITRKKGNKKIGINIGVTNKGEAWAEENTVLRFIVELSEILVERGWRIVYFPVSPPDEKLIEQAVREIGRPDSVEIFRNYLSVEKSLDLLESCDVFLGEKLHSVVLSICAITPSIMMEYRPKCLDFMASLGLEEFTFRIDRLVVDQVLEMIDDICEKSGHYQSVISERVGNYRIMQRNKSREVMEIFSKSMRQ